jgi:C-terminal novel E3 ligase, LRR-interacting
MLPKTPGVPSPKRPAPASLPPRPPPAPPSYSPCAAATANAASAAPQSPPPQSRRRILREALVREASVRNAFGGARPLGDVLLDIFPAHSACRLAPETFQTLAGFSSANPKSAAFLSALIDNLVSTPDYRNRATHVDLRERLRVVLEILAKHPQFLPNCNMFASRISDDRSPDIVATSPEIVATTFDELELGLHWEAAVRQPDTPERERTLLSLAVGLHRRTLLDQLAKSLAHTRHPPMAEMTAAQMKVNLRNTMAALSYHKSQTNTIGVNPKLQASEVQQALDMLKQADADTTESIQARGLFMAQWSQWSNYLRRQHPGEFPTQHPETSMDDFEQISFECAVGLTAKLWERHEMRSSAL